MTQGAGERGARGLAHEQPLHLGGLEVRPAVLTIAHGAAEETLEPRVMQVLVALARANGRVVTRDELIARCWDGRVVGEAAINRVISRLRKTAAALGGFDIETISKVGYRLRVLDGAADPGLVPAAPRPPSTSAASPPPGPPPTRAVWPASPEPRRAALAVLGAAGLGALALAWPEREREAVRPTTPTPSAADRMAAALVARGRETLRHAAFETYGQAVAHFRRATELAPRSAEAWGGLALAYRNQAEGAAGAAWTRSAAARALALDPAQADGRVALALNRPYLGNWAAIERDTRRLLARYPDHWMLHSALGRVLLETGRCEDAARVYGDLLARDPLLPHPRFRLALALWGAGRLPEAERAFTDALALWPSEWFLWHARVTFLAFTGRAEESAAFAGILRTRPMSRLALPHELAGLCGRALALPSSGATASAVAAILAARAAGEVMTPYAVLYLAAFGRLDDAFAQLDRYFGIAPGSRLGAYDDRWTYFLFLPLDVPLRADPRFAALTRAIGLDDYWPRTGTRPLGLR